MECPFSRTMIFSHRGRCLSDKKRRLENTISSISRIRKLGINGVETDIWLLKDSHTILFHDSKIKIINKKFSVEELTVREAKKFNRSFLLPGRKMTKWQKWNKPPTLGDLLKRFPDMHFNIELKFSHRTGLNEREKLWIKFIIGYLKTTGMKEKIIISSFNWDAIDYTNTLCKNIRMGYLLDSDQWDKAFEKGKKNNIYSLHPHYNLLNTHSIITARELNIKIITWTVNDITKMKEYFLAGLDGIITDYPGIAKKIRDYLCNSPGKS